MHSALPTTMHAMVIEHGALRPATLPIPHPAAGEALIRVAYAGVNRADLLQVAGSYPPPPDASPLPGLEISGTIAALGEGVEGWQVGDGVCALIAGGGYGEYAIAPVTQLLPLNGIGLRDAATLPEAAATALMALVSEAGLQPGERVLLHGGASGVGLLMGQIARALGAEAFATVGSPEKADFLKPFGIHPLCYRTAPFDEQLMAATANEGVDVVIDIIGAPYFARHLKLLRRHGRLVLLAMMGGNVVESLKLSGLFMKNLRVSAATLRNRTAAEKAALVAAVREIIWPRVARGEIRPVVDAVFPLAQAEKAHARMQERLHCGKILLEVAAKPPAVSA